MKIYNIGSLNVDYVYKVSHFVRPGETIATLDRHIFPGGKGLNQSVALSKAGATVIHGGIVGPDGEILINTLVNAGVDVSRIKHSDTPSGHAIIQVDTTGQNSIMLFSGANFDFDEAYLSSVLCDAEEGDIVLLQNEINMVGEIIKAAKSRSLRVAFNPSPYTENIKSMPLSLVDYWLCNEIEGGEITGKSEPHEIITEMHNMFTDANIVLTLGSGGSMFLHGDEVLQQDIFKVHAVDTTAAGDTYTGYFLAFIAEGKSPSEALRAAAAAAAVSVSVLGASSSIPTRRRVDDFLKENN